LTPDPFFPLEAIRKSKRGAIIEARVSRSGGHAYFYANPAVCSDLILLLRYRTLPGAAHGRPLGVSSDGFWQITD
jgi:hypothetical protein